MSKELLSVPDAARIARVSESRILGAIADGELLAELVGGRYVIRYDDLIEWLTVYDDEVEGNEPEQDLEESEDPDADNDDGEPLDDSDDYTEEE